MTRKILTFFLIILAAAISAGAAVHSVKDIPNVHLADARRYVSDPDGLLSPAMRDSLDAAIRRVWETSSAELAVVVVDRIEGGDIDSFATELFTDWGIGKEDNDNGVLYLVAMGDRKAVIRTGYGAEGVVPDIIAGRIIRSSNQYFKGGDTDGGVADAVGNLSYLLTTPGATEELMSKYANDRRRGGEETIDFFGIWIKISMFIAALMLIFFIITLVSTRRQNRYQRYIRLQQLQLPALIISFATIGYGACGICAAHDYHAPSAHSIAQMSQLLDKDEAPRREVGQRLPHTRPGHRRAHRLSRLRRVAVSQLR